MRSKLELPYRAQIRGDTAGVKRQVSSGQLITDPKSGTNEHGRGECLLFRSRPAQPQ